MTQNKINRLATKLTRKGETAVRKEHPWVFSDSIAKIPNDGQAGDLAIIYGQKSNKVMAVGLYDPDSPIRIKVIHHGGGATIDSNFFKEKIEAAFEQRKLLLETDTNAYRLIFGENDGLPGLIADIYDRVGVLKLYSAIWLPYLEWLVPHIAEVAQLETVVLRLSRNLQKLPLAVKEGDVLYGKLESPEVIFQEYGVRFKTNVLLGHKTGFFLDHRANRHRIGEMARGKTVLDVFAYAGGFSVHALAGGAKEVNSVDMSRQALELASQNGKLNNPAGKHITLTGDAFDLLQSMVKRGQQFDIVVIDPPSFAKSASEIATAGNKYASLAELGAKLTVKGGTLLLASCSSRVTAEEFYAIHREVFDRIGLNYSLIGQTEHDVDHPVNFPEGAYLKSAYYQM